MGTGRLTRGSEWRNCGAGRVGSASGARAALGEGLKEGAFGLLDNTDPLVARLRSKLGCQDGLSFAGGEQFLAIGLTYGSGFASNPGACTAWIGDSGLVRLLESRRSHGGALQGPGGGGAAWPRWRRASATRGCGAGRRSLGSGLRWRLGLLVRVWGRHREVAAALKRHGRSLGVRVDGETDSSIHTPCVIHTESSRLGSIGPRGVLLEGSGRG